MDADAGHAGRPAGNGDGASVQELFDVISANDVDRATALLAADPALANARYRRGAGAADCGRRAGADGRGAPPCLLPAPIPLRPTVFGHHSMPPPTLVPISASRRSPSPTWCWRMAPPMTFSTLRRSVVCSGWPNCWLAILV